MAGESTTTEIDTTTIEDPTGTGSGTPGGDGGTTTQGDKDKNTGGTWTPPSEAEWKAAQEKLKKANGQAAAHRKAADEAARKGETEVEAAVRAAREEAEAATLARVKPTIMARALDAAASKAGFTGSQEYLVRLIGDVELDDDFQPVDLDDRVRQLKRDLPQLFARQGPATIDGGDKDTQGGPRRSKDEEANYRLLKSAGLA